MHETMSRDNVLERLSTLDFMVRDLALYLNVNPEDERALAIHSQAAEDADALRRVFEANFGPLTTRTPSTTRWNWISDPWPWEAAANFELT